MNSRSAATGAPSIASVAPGQGPPTGCLARATTTGRTTDLLATDASSNSQRPSNSKLTQACPYICRIIEPALFGRAL